VATGGIKKWDKERAEKTGDLDVQDGLNRKF